MTKTQSLLLTSFESPAVIVPNVQPFKIMVNTLSGDYIVLGEKYGMDKERFILIHSPYQPGQELTGKVKCDNCNGQGSIYTGDKWTNYKLECENCTDGYLEKHIQLSSNIDEWQLIKFSEHLRREYLLQAKKDLVAGMYGISDNPYVFIVKQVVI